MPTKPVKQFTSWSFSRYKDHSGDDGCPYRAKLKHLDKVPEGPKGPALLRGEVIHKEAEDYTKGLVKHLPDSLKLFRREFQNLVKVRAIAEGKWAMDVNWQPVDFFDWTRAWCRVVLDAHYYLPKTRVAKVIDHKTGKVYSDNMDQIELYVIAGFAHYPAAQVIEPELWYLDQGLILPEKPKSFTRNDLSALKEKWKKKIIPLFTDRKFLPRPGEYCGRCAYSARRNGPCRF